jgi:hypothetical protein
MSGEHQQGSIQAVRKVQLSDGPAGRLVLPLTVAVLALAVIAWSAADAIRFFCVLGVLGLAIFSIAQILRRARENPVSASLDGAEVIQYQQCLGTKADPRMLPSELVANVIRPFEGRLKAPAQPIEAAPEPIRPPPNNLPDPLPVPESDPEQNP